MEIDEGERTHYQALRSTEEDLLSDSLLSEEFMELGSRRRKVQRPSSWWDALMPVSLKRHRASRTNTAFERWKANNRKAPSKAAVSLVASGIAMLLAFSLLIAYTFHLRNLIPRNDIQRILASWGDPNSPTEPLSHYPTSFSRDIHPIPCHSHNDYWRRVPLYEALAAGCTSVEADVWYSPTDLLVGHSISSLTETRTLRSLYLDPLLAILSRHNPQAGPLGTNSDSKDPHRNGIFDTSPDTPLVLLIDIKNDAEKVFAAVQEHLEPLRAGGWLTHFNGSAVVQGQITVVGTGDTPFDLLRRANTTTTTTTTYRDIFFDAPIQEFWGEDAPSASASPYTAENSYYASVNFEAAVGRPWHGVLTPKQVEVLRGQIGEARRRGLRARYWNTPAWPVRVREHVWDVLLREGAGMLNVDDLEGVSRRRWDGMR